MLAQFKQEMVYDCPGDVQMIFENDPPTVLGSMNAAQCFCTFLRSGTHRGSMCMLISGYVNTYGAHDVRRCRLVTVGTYIFYKKNEEVLFAK